MRYKNRLSILPLLACITLAAAPADVGTPAVAVAPQYGTSHVYVAPSEVNAFVASFLATFGGHSTKQVVATVTPTPSRTTSQLLQTPSGTVSLFGFLTPVPYPFGAERNGYLITNMDVAITAAQTCGADVLVSPFPDPIGRDAVIQWPGGVNMQIYWHTKTPSYTPFTAVPENRVYISPQRASAFIQSFTCFSHGTIVSDDAQAPGDEIGLPGTLYRRVRIESPFGRLEMLITDGHLPYPYGRETTGYQVKDLAATLTKATASGAMVLVPPFTAAGRQSAIVEFPGGYIAEIHASAS